MKIMKFWKYLLSLAVVSFALTACLKGATAGRRRTIRSPTPLLR